MNNEPSNIFTIVHPDRSGGLGSALRRAARVDPQVPPELARMLDDLPAPRRAPRRMEPRAGRALSASKEKPDAP